MLSKSRVKPASKGEPSLLVFTLPASASSLGEDVEVFALPLEFREGGMLLALPQDLVSLQTIEAGQAGVEETLFGPSTKFSVELLEENEEMTETISLGVEAQVLVIDMHDDVLLACREYDPVTDSTAAIMGFSIDHPQSLPDATKLMSLVSEWLLQRSDDRTGFYTAQEDLSSPPKRTTAAAAAPKKQATAKRVSNAAIAEQLSSLMAQMQLLAKRQDNLEKGNVASAAPVPGQFFGPTAKLPALSAGLPNQSGLSQTGVAKALTLVGPPPKVRLSQPLVPAQDVAADEPYDMLQPAEGEAPDIAAAIAQQSTAITALVAHLASQSSDVLGDLSAVGQPSSSTKGVQRRERMQSELALGTSSYFLQVQQQLHRRMYPSRPVPQTEAELQNLSVLQYLERMGGYKNHRELGLVAWILGHAVDAAANGNFKLTKEIIALLLVSVEQAAVDRGDWTLAFMLSLLEEPPMQVFQDRTMSMVHHTRPFGPLVPPAWTAVCLSYLKDLEVLSTKKTETAKKNVKAPPVTDNPSTSAEPDREASPKRKPRFPKKPKAKSPQDA